MPVARCTDLRFLILMLAQELPPRVRTGSRPILRAMDTRLFNYCRGMTNDPAFDRPGLAPSWWTGKRCNFGASCPIAQQGRESTKPAQPTCVE